MNANRYPVYVLNQKIENEGLNPAAYKLRAGDFDVMVTRPGYQTVRMTGIRVGRDECHVIPVAVAVDLRPGS